MEENPPDARGDRRKKPPSKYGIRGPDRQKMSQSEYFRAWNYGLKTGPHFDRPGDCPTNYQLWQMVKKLRAEVNALKYPETWGERLFSRRKRNP